MNPWIVLGWIVVAWFIIPTLILLSAAIRIAGSAIREQWILQSAKYRLRRALKRTLDQHEGWYGQD